MNSVPSAPRNVTVITKDNTLNVFWQRPKYEYTENIHYVISWRKTGSNDKYERKDVTSNHHLIKNLSKLLKAVMKNVEILAQHNDPRPQTNTETRISLYLILSLFYDRYAEH